MTPPRTGGDEAASASEPESAVGLSCRASAIGRITTLARRPDFLRASSARRQGTQGFLLQARERRADEVAHATRVGFTCSRKVGNAVLRNRAKRRLRAIARDVIPRLGRAGWDYVLVGRPGATVERTYLDLIADLERAMASVHSPPRPRASSDRDRP